MESGTKPTPHLPSELRMKLACQPRISRETPESSVCSVISDKFPKKFDTTDNHSFLTNFLIRSYSPILQSKFITALLTGTMIENTNK